MVKNIITLEETITKIRIIILEKITKVTIASNTKEKGKCIINI